VNNIQFPLNELQVSLLKMTENLQEDELQDFKRLLIAYKAQRLAVLADRVWEEKGWSDQIMQNFLNTHMRTPYKSNRRRPVQ
jgi:hypothetical protein